MGSAQAGDTLVPSGFEDGTATKKKGCGRIFGPAVRLCVVENDVEADWASSESTAESVEVELLPVNGLITAQLQNWQHVDCIVIQPSQTVLPRPHMCLFIGGVVLLLCMASVLLVVSVGREHTTAFGCDSIALQHGSLLGGCSGVAGSTCKYGGCDPGYGLVPVGQESQDTDPSAQAVNPLGGCLHGNITQPFPPCTTCFGDGLMCEPKGRAYPLPAPVRPNSTTQADLIFWPEYPYMCPRTAEALSNCEPEGRVCFGPYNGYPPCEYCNAQRDGNGLACEASSRYVRWNMRDNDDPQGNACPLADDDDHYHCHSSSDPHERELCGFPQPVRYSPCGCEFRSRLYGDPRDQRPSHPGEASAPAGSGCWGTNLDDVTRLAKLCIPIGDGRIAGTSHQHPHVSTAEEEPATNASAISCKPVSAATQVADAVTSNTTRHCANDLHRKQLGVYDGVEMHCVRRYCPAETLSMLRLGACRFCEGKDATLSIPR